MSDLSEKGSDLEEQSKTPDQFDCKKTCLDCGTSKTPLWRGGPGGPKSLCNACGIRSRKKRRAVLGVNRGGGGGGGGEDRKVKKNSIGLSSSSSSSSGSSNNSGGGGSSSSKIGENLKQRLWTLGREVMRQRRSTVEKQQRRKLGEEEQAAVLLMALSCGSVYA